MMFTQGLGKGGAKRHRKILRDNIQGITKPVSFLFAVIYGALFTKPHHFRPFVASPVVVVSNESPASFTKRLAVFSRSSWRMSFAILSLILNMPNGMS